MVCCGTARLTCLVHYAALLVLIGLPRIVQDVVWAVQDVVTWSLYGVCTIWTAWHNRGLPSSNLKLCDETRCVARCVAQSSQISPVKAAFWKHPVPLPYDPKDGV